MAHEHGIPSVRHDRPERGDRARRRSSARPGFAVVVSIAIVAFTGCFHLFRGAYIDGIIYLAVAAVLTLDALGRLPAVAASHRSRARSLTLLVGCVVLGFILVLAPQNSLIDAATVTAIGAATLLLAWPDPEPLTDAADGDDRRTRSLRRTAILWAIVGVAGCLWELTTFFIGRYSPATDFEVPALSDLIGPLFGFPLGRLVLVTAWLVVGCYLLRRGGR